MHRKHEAKAAEEAVVVREALLRVRTRVRVRNGVRVWVWARLREEEEHVKWVVEVRAAACLI